jgi:hypothetical protein
LRSRASIRGGKILADAQVAGALFHRAKGYEHEAVRIFLPEGHVDEKTGEPIPVVVRYVKRYAPDVNAAKFWLMNRRGDRWREKQQIEVADPIAAMTPEQRLAQVVEIMAKARALLAANPEPDDVTDAEYEETEK